MSATAASNDARSRLARSQGVALPLLATVLMAIWALALLSYSPWDAAFSTSGDDAPARNWLGAYGAYIADISYMFFGYSVWLLWLCLAMIGVRRWRKRHAPKPKGEISFWRFWSFWIGLALMLCSASALEWSHLHRYDALLPSNSGGALGLILGTLSEQQLGFHWASMLWTCLLVHSFSWAMRFSWLRLAEWLGAFITQSQHHLEDKAVGEQAAHARQEALIKQEARHSHPAERQEPSEPGLAAVSVAAPSAPASTPHPAPNPAASQAVPTPAADTAPPPLTTPPVVAPIIAPPPEPAPSQRVLAEKQNPLFDDLQTRLPRVHLLDPAAAHQESISTETLEMTSRLIERKLQDFGVHVTVIAAYPGPVITRYEIEPAVGVKGSQIVNLAKDLARSLSLVSIRVIETIPGKNYMALELPNAKRQTICLSEIIGSSTYDNSKSLLTLALGKDIVGQPVVADLAKMPHLLVAGTTGSGKSVGINAMILSLLYKAEAHQVRLMLIDPKMLEMSVYEGIPHLLCPVVTDMHLAENGLNWCVAEMEKRYRLMSKMGVRNLAGYNSKVIEAAQRGKPLTNPFSLTPEDPEALETLPNIVIVIDELADLMMVVGKKVEHLIARLAQKARAAGIHLILATQRPSVDVITGLIKANVPTRIAFQVSSKIDSRTILEQMGAETLLGMGDMLYLPSGTGLPTRVHGAFVSDDEVHRVVEQLKEFGESNYIDGVLEGGNLDDAQGEGVSGSSNGENDPLYDEAVAAILKSGKVSTSLLQRQLRIGYGRAARILEEMENAGLISKMDHRNQRQLLAPNPHGDG